MAAAAQRTSPKDRVLHMAGELRVDHALRFVDRSFDVPGSQMATQAEIRCRT
jgi:hypothetical protein